jgi:hypothetical protein
MSVRVVWEVRQRAWTPKGSAPSSVSRELGFFTDDAMAEQAIQACYREAWKTVLSSEFGGSIWFPVESKEEIGQQGWDIWYPDDVNSSAPIFYKVSHRLWNQVPSSVNNFTFTLEGANPF